MKKIIGQIIGYIVIVLIMACIVWFMMYKYNEKLELKQEEHKSVRII